MALTEIIESRRIDHLVVPCPSIQKTAKISEFMNIIKKGSSDFAAVLDERKVVGLVTDKHLLKLVKNYPRSKKKERKLDMEALKSPVSTIMSPKPLTAKLTDSLEYVASRCAKHDMRFMLVVDGNKTLIGCIPLVNIIETIAR